MRSNGCCGTRQVRRCFERPLEKLSLTGQTISHYEVLEQLGAGGMGVVYKARDTVLKRSVALKVLPPAYRQDPDRRRRFVREAQAASALNHPNIAGVYDIFEHDGVDFIVMEYVDGKPLGEIIPKHGMPLSRVLPLAIQITDALAQAHDAELVHRDLKPANIMVRDDGTVKVLDFGLAKLVGGQSGADSAHQSRETSTEEGLILGTVSYMSPEQAQGKPVDARSDIFAVGAVLYEMVTGRRAFSEDSAVATLAAIVHQDPPPPSELRRDIPAELGRWIVRCLRKDPARRAQHMSDIKVALEDLKDETIINGRTLPNGGSRRRSGAIRTRLAVAILVVVALVSWHFLGREPAPEQFRVSPLTAYPGIERDPSFSPDGSQVAFAWDGGRGDFDIYVKPTETGEPVRLTFEPNQEVATVLVTRRPAHCVPGDFPR